MDGAEEAAMDLKDEQWAVLAPLIPEPRRRGDGRGRPWRAAAAVAGPSPAPGGGAVRNTRICADGWIPSLSSGRDFAVSGKVYR